MLLTGADLQIQEKLAEYLGGKISLQAFEDWFVPETWEMNQPDRLTDELVGEIELRLAEYTNGHLSEDELREKLRPFVTNYEVQVTTGGPRTTGATAAVTVEHSHVDKLVAAAPSSDSVLQL